MIKRPIVTLITLACGILNSTIALQAWQTAEEISKDIAGSWILLLDEQKYGESWEALSPNTKAKLDKRKWELAMTGMREHLGKLKKRKEVKVEHIKSLAGYPDQEGAVAVFESTFEHRDAVRETVGIIHDKDRKWRVVAYVTN